MTGKIIKQYLQINFIQQLSMQQTGRRSLRNKNTCPTVINPFHKDMRSEQLESLVPHELLTLLTHLSQINCGNIQNFPILHNLESFQQAKIRMRQAELWQQKSVQNQFLKCNQLQKIEQSANIIHIELLQPQEIKNQDEYGFGNYGSHNIIEKQLHQYINDIPQQM